MVIFHSAPADLSIKWLISIFFPPPHVYAGAKPPIYRSDRMRHFWSQFIIGGTEVEDVSQFAYQLSMRFVEVHVCGASIIALHWALTAGSRSCLSVGFVWCAFKSCSFLHLTGHCFERYFFAELVIASEIYLQGLELTHQFYTAELLNITLKQPKWIV